MNHLAEKLFPSPALERDLNCTGQLRDGQLSNSQLKAIAGLTEKSPNRPTLFSKRISKKAGVEKWTI